MQKRILHLGGSMPSVHRFWDIVEASDVFFYTDTSQNICERLNRTRPLLKGLGLDSEALGFRGDVFKLPRFLKIYAAICRRSQFNNKLRLFWLGLSVAGLPIFVFYSLVFRPRLDVSDYDVIWIGGNNFDRSNVIFLWFKYGLKLNINVQVVRSYKESSGMWSLDEYLMLKQRAFYFFPSQEYVPFYEEIYGKNIFSRAKGFRYIDEDSRYSKLIRYLQVQNDVKIKNSVVILTGRLLLTSVTPSDSRYIYIDYCKELVNSGYRVFIHTQRVTEVVAEVYRGLSGVEVLGPLDLESKLDAYTILRRYEFGVMHNPTVQVKLSEFTKINVPNRFYEYDMCDVEPLDFRRVESVSFQNFTSELLSLVE